MSITSAKFVACAFVVIGALTLGNHWTVVPAAAEGDGGGVIAIQATNAGNPELTFVALLDDERKDADEREEREEREGAERREREGERREAAEGREREQPRREGEARREGDRPREGGEPREGERRREDFRPKTDNEELLYKMILQLRREVAELRNALRSRDGDVRREGGEREPLRREGADQPRREGADKPRGEGADQPRREGADKPRGEGADKPRGEGADKPRGEGADKPRERDGERPAPPKEGERRGSDES